MHDRIERVFREDYGRALAALIAFCRDFSLAEDALQDAVALALERWPADGVPSAPAAWLLTTAKRKIIDHARRDRVYARKLELLGYDGLHTGDWDDEAIDDPDSEIPDERLALIFTCCHPAIAPETQVALTLRTLGGLSTEEIARAFLATTATTAQRLVRAQRKISDAGIPYAVPAPQHLAERMQAVLSTLYLIFNEGYAATRGDALIRHDLCNEAIRLARVLAGLVMQPGAPDGLRPHCAEVLGLLALMLLQHSRRAARLDGQGGLVLLEDQDRSRWDRRMIDEGVAMLDDAIAMRRIGPYQLQAAIAALHAQAPAPADTDWPQIAALYGELVRLTPSPVIALNRTVAIAMAEGPLRGLQHLEQTVGHALDNYHLFHAVRADLLRRLGRRVDAHAAYARAHALCATAAEKSFLEKRLKETRP
jgi:RNA polymerase sigma-70 factor, ECF subfamily